MEKICHITSVHKRYDVRIFEKECVSLKKDGYEVTLLVNDDLDDEVKDGVKIVSTRFQPSNKINRILFSTNKMKNQALKINAKIYHLHDPELLSLGKILKKNGKIVIFDSHEDVVEQIKDKEWIPKLIRNLVSFYFSRLQKNALSKFDAVISVTPHLVEKLKIINKNTIMVTNYPKISYDKPKRKKQGYICFAGGISSQWCHEQIIDALEGIEGVKYLLAGKSGENYKNILEEKTGWNKVEYLGVVNHSEVIDIYEKSFAGMAINYSKQAKGIGTLGNTKLFEFMEAELPVICTNYILWKEIIEGNNCGFCVEYDDIEGIKKSIQYLKDNREIALEMGKNGRKAVIEKYNWDIEEKKLVALYEGLLLNAEGESIE